MSDDITRDRHGGNPESTAAHRAVDKVKQYAIILAFFERCGRLGATSDEAERALGKMHQSVSARISELVWGTHSNRNFVHGQLLRSLDRKHLTARGGQPARVHVHPKHKDPDERYEDPSAEDAA